MGKKCTWCNTLLNDFQPDTKIKPYGYAILTLKENDFKETTEYVCPPPVGCFDNLIKNPKLSSKLVAVKMWSK